MRNIFSRKKANPSADALALMTYFLDNYQANNWTHLSQCVVSYLSLSKRRSRITKSLDRAALDAHNEIKRKVDNDIQLRGREMFYWIAVEEANEKEDRKTKTAIRRMMRKKSDRNKKKGNDQ